MDLEDSVSSFDSHNAVLKELKYIANQYIASSGFKTSDYQEDKIHEVLWDYALDLCKNGLDEEPIDQIEVVKLVQSIIL